MSKEAQCGRWLAGVMTVGALAAPSPATAQEINLIGELSDSAAQRRTRALCRAGDGVQKVDPKVARRLYVRAINTGALRTKCAVYGFRKLAEAAKAEAEKAPKAIDKARALIDNGYAEEGDELLKGQLAAAPAATIPEDLQPDNRALETAEALWSQGYETEAQEQVRGALAADPANKDSIPAQLQKAERKPVEVRQVIGRLGAGLVTVALVAGLVALLAVLARAVVLHVRRRIVTERFEGGTESAGAALQAEMQDRFHDWAGGSVSHQLGTAAGTDEGFRAASLNEALPQVGLLMEALGALDRLLPNRTWVLAGQFLPAEPKNGVGLALRLYRKSNGKILLADTLRQAEFQAPPAGGPDDAATKLAYQRLAIACAAFVLFADQGNLRLLKSYGTLGTANWRSYAMANSAATYYPSEPDVARKLYRRALEHDEEYKDARFGMAVIDLQRAEGNPPKLVKVEEELARVATDLEPTKSLWYRTQFWRLVGLMYRGEDEQARHAAETLFGSGTQWWDKKPSGELKSFLPKHRDTMLVAAAAALQRAGQPAPAWLAGKLRGELDLPPDPVSGHAIVTKLEERKLHWRTTYNLAGYYAFVQPPGGWIGRSLEHLETALNTGGAEYAEYASRDWTLKALRDAAGPQFRKILRNNGFKPD